MGGFYFWNLVQCFPLIFVFFQNFCPQIVPDEATQKRYNFLVENYDKRGFPKSFKEFKKVMYNNGTENKTLKAYIKAREKGTGESVVSFYDYVDAMKQLDKEVIGINTVDNQDIISYSNHLIDRIFGVREDPDGHKRIGVSIDEIKEMLKQGKTKYLKISTKYIINEGYVVLNKQGNLVTVVPRKETKR
ncbi:hypothetical protein [Lactobacillus sp. LL6]|uniref:hypothetical protein n=1 Tax=Lactobacillus sp. LL6 TaxID=2596827 RepID=UPI00118638DC|nr:hypothetical protein [Lactobacillus sp. LL6]TSO25471.1 hypothetical protein FOD82_09610 [Lactobacillus sp. LL6]